MLTVWQHQQQQLCACPCMRMYFNHMHAVYACTGPAMHWEEGAVGMKPQQAVHSSGRRLARLLPGFMCAVCPAGHRHADAFCVLAGDLVPMP